MVFSFTGKWAELIWRDVMSLYQEVRPDDFKDMVGNSSVVGGLRVMVKKPPKSRTHCILFKGPSGCGKTTFARILAKCFGSSGDSVFEYNSANTNGIATVREIANTACVMGFGGKVKTYIFDESHEFQPKAQEALLKVLEENPPHCYFIFCTTSPESIIPTIRSRCTEYEVEKLMKREIMEVLDRACEVAEPKLKVSSEVLEAITLTCDGSARVALVSLEQVDGIESIDAALELLVRGTEKDVNVIDLLKLLSMGPVQRRKKWKQIIRTFDGISADNEVIRRSILTFLYHKLLKYDEEKDAMDITHLLKIFSVNTFYGKKSQLGSLIARACFETWGD